MYVHTYIYRKSHNTSSDSKYNHFSGRSNLRKNYNYENRHISESERDTPSFNRLTTNNEMRLYYFFHFYTTARGIVGKRTAERAADRRTFFHWQTV